MNSETWLIIWIGIAVCAAIIEGVTVSIVSCWFVVGAVFAIGAGLLGANTIIQFVVFVVVSALSLIIARPLIKKRNKADSQPTNADMLIGKEAVVTEEINNISETGAIKINGLVWTARSESGAVIPADEIVVIERIEGVKVIVK